MNGFAGHTVYYNNSKSQNVYRSFLNNFKIFYKLIAKIIII
jgi:hypothetical protein